MTATARGTIIRFLSAFFLVASLFLAACQTGGRDGATRIIGLKSANDLRDKKIGVLLGSTQDHYATNKYPNADISRFNTSADVVNALKAGQIDASIDDEVFAQVILRREKDLAVLERGLMVESMGIGFRKDQPELREAFNAFLFDLKKSGLYQEIRNRWINMPESATMPSLPPPGTGGTLILGTADLGLPFSTLSSGGFVGFDIEVMERFARNLNKKLSIQNMTFSGLIAALASGKVDLIASCVTITTERKKQIDFSDPYFESGTVALVLAKNLTLTQNPAEARGGVFRGIADSFYNNIIYEDRYMLILDGLQATVIISIFALVFGTLLGAAVCFMRMSRNRLLALIAKGFISILRGTPLLVLLMMMFYVVFASVNIDPILAAIFTFGLNFAAYVSEMFRMAIGSVDEGQVEAGIALGFTRFQTFLHIVLPQAARHVLPVYKGEFISMVKMTSVVGYIAVQDLTKASDIIRSRTFDAFFPLVLVAVIYFVITYILTLFLTIIEKSLDGKARRKLVETT